MSIIRTTARTTARIAATAIVAAGIIGATATPASAVGDFGFEPFPIEEFDPDFPIGVLQPSPTVEWQTINAYDQYGPFALPVEAEGQVWSVFSNGCDPEALSDAWTLTVDTTYAESVVWSVDGDRFRVDSTPEATPERSPSLPMAGWTKLPSKAEAPWVTPDLDPGTYQVEAQAFSGNKGTGNAGEIARFELEVLPGCSNPPTLTQYFAS